ncbi:MAG: hypothetical protein ACRELX_18125, partial [Longimicrobiales bacterium]
VTVSPNAACADTATDTTTTAGVVISSAPGIDEAASPFDLSGARPAALPGRPFRLRIAGRVRRHRRNTR